MDYNPCFIIPCYNHGKTVPALVTLLGGYGLACFVVDDGSSPDTSSILDELGRKHDWLTLLRHAQNQGKGAAVMTGMREAWRQGFTHAIQLDADGQHDLEDLPTILALSKETPTALVSGRPVFDSTVPKSRLYGRYLTHVWVWIETLSLQIKDSMCGFRAYPLSPCVELLGQEHLGRWMDFDTEIMVRLYWRRVPVTFFDTHVVYPEGGLSHFRILRDNLLISWMHTRLFCGMLTRLPGLIAYRAVNQRHWSAKKERGGKIGLRFMLWAYKAVGRSFFNLLLYPVMAYFWLTGSAARKASQDYLRRVQEYATKTGHPLSEDLNSYRHFMNFGHSLLDKAAAWNGDIKLTDADFPEVELYREVVRSGKGILVIGAHLGNLELCRALGDQTGDVTVHSIVFTHHAEQFNRLLQSINPRTSINHIQVSDMSPATAILLQQKIDQGEWVVIVADRTPMNSKKGTVRVDFLGDRAAFPQGPFVLASLLKCPVYLMFGLREKSGLKIHFELFSERLILPRRERAASLKMIAQSFADRLAGYCLRAPLEWFNFYDFWEGSDEKNES